MEYVRTHARVTRPFNNRRFSITWPVCYYCRETIERFDRPKLQEAIFRSPRFESESRRSITFIRVSRIHRAHTFRSEASLLYISSREPLESQTLGVSYRLDRSKCDDPSRGAATVGNKSRICMILRSAGLVPENRRRKKGSRHVSVINDPRLVSAPTTRGGCPLSSGSLLARICAFRGKTSFNGVNRHGETRLARSSARAHCRDTCVGAAIDVPALDYTSLREMHMHRAKVLRASEHIAETRVLNIHTSRIFRM